MLVTDRRRSVGMRDDERHGHDPWQGSLFGPDPAAPAARPASPTPDPFAGTRSAPAADSPPAPAAAPAAHAGPGSPAAADLLAPAPEPAEVIEPADYLEDPTELEPVHADHAAVRGLLVGPTLDDIMSRAWEGLRAEVPTPCPVCRTEIEPSAGGRCGACGSTLD